MVSNTSSRAYCRRAIDEEGQRTTGDSLDGGQRMGATCGDSNSMIATSWRISMTKMLFGGAVTVINVVIPLALSNF